jgi:glycosyltransferase involved in cell wall biosynthesis
MDFISWFWVLCIVVGILYFVLIVWFLNGWKLISEFKREKKSYNTKVSVLVPFYNEELTLERCIKDLEEQEIDTSFMEIILIDDSSTDKSTDIAQKYAEKYATVHCEQNEGDKGKKGALQFGIDKSVGDLIVVTDADCRYPSGWLANLVEYYEQHNPNMIVGPVVMEGELSLFHKFQEFEFVNLVASGAGAIGINHPIMCNGANLAFNKEVFYTIKDPFNMKYESGDDVFLLHNMKKIANDKIHFIKSSEAIVTTVTNKNITDFFNQRFRWISKAPGYRDSDTKFSAFVIFATSFLWMVGLGLTLFNDFHFLKPTLFLFLLKTFVDTIFYKNISSFFNKNKLLRWILIFQIMYGIYITIAGFFLFVNSFNSKRYKANTTVAKNI